MTDDQAIFSHCSELKRQSADNSMIIGTPFLDMRQRTLLLPLEKVHSEYVKTFYFGGYDDAERVCAVFVPKYFEEQNAFELFEAYSEDCPITLLRIDKDRFTVLSHRDYLGSLMGLGIKREVLGDIVTDENGAFLFCQKQIKPYIIENLKSAGRASLNVKEASLKAFSKTESKSESRFFSLASLRLDNVVACAFSLSRTKSVAAIEGGLVFVDGVQCEKCDRRVAQGEKIVLRGKGRAFLKEIKGESKKGRVQGSLVISK